MRIVRLVPFVVLLLAVPLTHAATMSDDFADGAADGWTTSSNILSGGPAIFDASTGSFRMSSTGIVLENDTGIGADFTESLTDPGFSNGVFEATAVVDNAFTSAALTLRGNGLGPGFASGYSFSLNNALDTLFVLAFSPSRPDCTATGSCFEVLGQAPFVVSEGVAYRLRASAVGAELAFTVWEASGAEPAAPQIMVSDAELAVGAISVGIGKSFYLGAPTEGISGSFDDISFVPEPGTALLLGLGLAGLTATRRRA